jgi:outer membrane protein OmpA-like peptidoglycan-associated protein
MKFVKVFIVFIFFFSNDIIGQEKNGLTDSTCSQIVSGVVKNRTTNDFIRDASVKLYQGTKFIKTSVTNSKGEYSFKVNCKASYSLISDKTNYTSSNREFTTSNVENISVGFSIYLEEAIPICDQILNGRILDDLTNEPIENATVLINDISGNTIKTDQTNSSGNYHFNLPCNQVYKLVISIENYITFSEDIKTNKIDNNIQRIDFSLKSNKCTRIIQGRVFNAENNLPISESNIRLLKNTVELDSKNLSIDGGFSIEAKCNSNYTLKVSSEGFSETTITISSFDKNTVLKELRIGLDPFETQIEIDTTIVNNPKPIIINTDNQPSIEPITQSTNETVFSIPIIEPKNIAFDLNDSVVNRKIAVELNKIVTLMRFSPEIKFEFKSHTDSRGPDQYNLNLTEARAQSMVSFIISKGIESHRVSGKGYGETELLNECSNKNECNESLHQENKRIEYIITTNGNK